MCHGENPHHVPSAGFTVPPQQARPPGLACWLQGPEEAGSGGQWLSNHRKSLSRSSWFNSAVTTCSISQHSAIGYRLHTAIKLIPSVCFFKKHQGFMRGTLMGADKEWIYSFSTWDYLLPGSTQLASEWRARLCQQSAESALLHRKAKSLPVPPVALLSASPWLPAPSSTGDWTQTNSLSAGERTWYFICLSPPLPYLGF